MLTIIRNNIIFALLITIIFLSIVIDKAFANEIILDPGHSPNKSGAVSCIGVKEYKYNDELVNHIRYELNKNKINNKITRLPTQNISLASRTNDTKGAKLFLSIHHDSVQPQFIKYLNGNPTSKKAEGYSIFVSRKNKYFNKSVDYARSIAEYLYNIGLRPSTHHGEQIRGENREILDDKLGIYVFDDLVVLKKSQCPAVLLEAGVIVNPTDEKKVKTEEFKSGISRAVISAINKVSE